MAKQSNSVERSEDGKLRCWWCAGNTLYEKYHDKEWGVPLHDDRALFELLILEGFQAGLSWLTVLKKRENFRKAFKNFDPKRVSRITPQGIERLLQNEGIIRNRLKVEGTIKNAKGFLKVQKEFGTFHNFIWQFTNHKPLRSKRPLTRNKIPTTTKESDAMSKALKSHGFTFVGSTICYAFMQASGMVNDHVDGCSRTKS